MVKKVVVLFFVFMLAFDSLALSVEDGGVRKELDIAIADNISNGFSGVLNKDFDQFLSDMRSLSTSVSRGNVTYVQKRFNNRNLLLGHRIVAFSGETLRNEPLDVVGLVGGTINYAEKSYQYLMPKYDKVVFWLGINDLLVERLLYADDAKVFSDVTSAFDRLHKQYSSGGAKVYFMSISPTADAKFNNIIHNVNIYLTLKYNIINTKYFPDQNEYHFYSKTFRKIYDEQIKPVLEGD